MKFTVSQCQAPGDYLYPRLTLVSQYQAAADYLYPRLTLVSQCQAASDYLYPRLTITIPVLGGLRCDIMTILIEC